MNIKSVLPLLVCALVAFMPTSSAHALTTNEALARMDQIIKEMEALRSEFAALVGSVGTTPAASVPGQVLGASTKKYLTDDLGYGATNDSIARIQRLLKTDSEIYPEGTVSGFFGPKTQDAIRRFQARFGLDTVGVVGPSTTAILEAFMAAYPDENYPSGVLSKAVPQVQGASTSVSTPVVSTPSVSTSGRTFRSISLEKDYNEYVVRSSYSDGTRFGDFVITAEDEDELVSKIAKKLGIAESTVRSLVDLKAMDDDSGDKQDAEDAIADAKSEIADAKREINDADDDGDDVSDAEDYYDEARDAYSDAKDAFDDEEYQDAIDYADDAVRLAKKAVKAIN